MRSLPRRLPVRAPEPPSGGGPIPALERADVALLGILAAVGLVPFAGLALGALEGGGRLLLGAALVLVCGGQLLAGLRHPSAGGRSRGLRVPGPRLVLLRGHLGPRAPVRPPLRSRR